MQNLNKIETRIKNLLENITNYKYIHGSDENYLENVAFSFGVLAENIKEKINFKDITKIYNYFYQVFDKNDSFINTDFNKMLISNSMLFLNTKLNLEEKVFKKYFLERLERVYRFVTSNKNIFYTPEEKDLLKGIPTVWKNTIIVRKENTNPYSIIPQIYDVLGYNAMYSKLENKYQIMIDKIIDFIFSEKYQKEVINGYGIGIYINPETKKKKYYAVGWDISLNNLSPTQELTYMYLFSNISSARNKEWYMNNISKYKDLSIFSNQYFQDKKTYWVFNGLYFGYNNITEINQYIKNKLYK